METFIKWLDGELSTLVDERSVLKHFPQWPEQKVDALREAACNYRELKNLESEVSSYEDNPKEPISMALKRIQALQDRRACTKIVELSLTKVFEQYLELIESFAFKILQVGGKCK